MSESTGWELLRGCVSFPLIVGFHGTTHIIWGAYESNTGVDITTDYRINTPYRLYLQK